MSSGLDAHRSGTSAIAAAEVTGGGVELLLGSAGLVDVGAFCVRVLRLDPSGLVRLRTVGERVTLYSMLPLDVLVSLTVQAGQSGASDLTVTVADLLNAIEGVAFSGRQPDQVDDSSSTRSGHPLVLAATSVRDGAWRGTLPPLAGWSRLDLVPVTAIAAAVRAGNAAFESARGRPDAAAVGGTLLDHQTLRVSDGERRVTLPLRVLYAVWRMGFLGADPAGSASHCAVSVTTGGWTRLAAPHGSVYHQHRPALPVLPR